MRNAAATLDDDFGYDAPIRKKSAPRPRSAAPGKKKKKGKRFDFSFDRVARYGAIGISATVAIGIMVNALMMQKGHHPAPLFGKGKTLAISGNAAEQASTATLNVAQPPSPTEAVAATQAAPAADTSAAAIAGKARRPAPVHHDTMEPSGDDPIGRLLGGGGAATPTIDKAEGKTVLGVQKALGKLGFNVKASGTLGPATKKAIEAFEKDRHLPVKGELSRRLVKVLAAESGIRID